MELLIKAAALGVAGAVLAMLLRKNAPELALTLSIAVCLLAAGMAMEMFAQLRQIVELARERTGLSPAVVGPVLKCVGIGVVTRLAAELCRDAGQGAVSSAVELCGACCAMVTAIPLLRAMLQLIGDLT